jgi:uncharacterized membrane protein
MFTMSLEMQRLMNWILKVAVGTLASVMVAVVFVLLVGIFLPNEQIDNKEILAIIGPAFNTVIGAFVGLLGGLSINSSASKPEASAAPEPETPEEPEPDLGPHPDHPDEKL